MGKDTTYEELLTGIRSLILPGKIGKKMKDCLIGIVQSNQNLNIPIDITISELKELQNRNDK